MEWKINSTEIESEPSVESNNGNSTGSKTISETPKIETTWISANLPKIQNIQKNWTNQKILIFCLYVIILESILWMLSKFLCTFSTTEKGRAPFVSRKQVVQEIETWRHNSGYSQIKN